MVFVGGSRWFYIAPIWFLSVYKNATIQTHKITNIMSLINLTHHIISSYQKSPHLYVRLYVGMHAPLYLVLISEKIHTRLDGRNENRIYFYIITSSKGFQNISSIYLISFRFFLYLSGSCFPFFEKGREKGDLEVSFFVLWDGIWDV